MTRQPPPPWGATPLRAARGRDVVSRAAGNTVSSRRGVRVVARGCARPRTDRPRRPARVRPARISAPSVGSRGRNLGSRRGCTASFVVGWVGRHRHRARRGARASPREPSHPRRHRRDAQGVPVPRAQLELGGGDARVPLHRLAGDARAPRHPHLPPRIQRRGGTLERTRRAPRPRRSRRMRPHPPQGALASLPRRRRRARRHRVVRTQAQTDPRPRAGPEPRGTAVESNRRFVGYPCSSPNKRREARRPGASSSRGSARAPASPWPSPPPKPRGRPRSEASSASEGTSPSARITRRRPRRASRAHTPSVSPSPRTFDARRRPRYCATGGETSWRPGSGRSTRARALRARRKEKGAGRNESRVEVLVSEDRGHDLGADEVWRARWWLRSRLERALG